MLTTGHQYFNSISFIQKASFGIILNVLYFCLMATFSFKFGEAFGGAPLFR